MKIGFIGLGIMGSRMAGHLQKAGYDLTVHNRTKSKADELLANGARWADTPAEAANDAEIVITMLAHPDAVRTTATAFLPAMREGALWIDCSTVNPSFSREMGALAKQHNLTMLDAPVAGSKKQAAHADLTFIVGGAEDDVERARLLFDVMGGRVAHVGGQGMGTSLKVVVNMMLAQTMLAFAEGLALGESLGLPRELLLNILIGGPVVAPFVAGKRNKLESRDYSDIEFPLRWMQKDLHMATLTAYESGAPLPLANATKEAFQMAIAAGMGDLDFSAIYELLNPKAD